MTLSERAPGDCFSLAANQRAMTNAIFTSGRVGKWHGASEFVERVNIPRISFLVSSLQVIAAVGRTRSALCASSAASACERVAYIYVHPPLRTCIYTWLRTCATAVCTRRVRAYMRHVVVYVGRRATRTCTIYPGPQLGNATSKHSRGLCDKSILCLW